MGRAAAEQELAGSDGRVAAETEEVAAGDGACSVDLFSPHNERTAVAEKRKEVVVGLEDDGETGASQLVHRSCITIWGVQVRRHDHLKLVSNEQQGEGCS